MPTHTTHNLLQLVNCQIKQHFHNEVFPNSNQDPGLYVLTEEYSFLSEYSFQLLTTHLAMWLFD